MAVPLFLLAWVADLPRKGTPYRFFTTHHRKAEGLPADSFKLLPYLKSQCDDLTRLTLRRVLIALLLLIVCCSIYAEYFRVLSTHRLSSSLAGVER